MRMVGIHERDIRDRETAEAVWALQHPAYRAEASLIGVSELPPLRDTVETLQSCGESFIGFGNEEGELIGAVSYENDGKTWTVCRLMVHPDHHRKGIGTRLMESLLSIQEKKVWTVTAEVRNLPAISLYERFGFQGRDTIKPMPGIVLLRLVREPEEAAEERVSDDGNST
ncbi:GNAT family N-acetyltransferase [Cohnella suwonensis]|uniref:GNAT family N-acetyltransferase n=1 Tax=Cohnella suwonensis TaxID=696072 RepID=A0ABW0LRS1_9BACL